MTSLTFPRRVPLCDHAGTVLSWLNPAQASETARKPGIGIIRTKHRIKALQYLGPDPAALTGGSHHRRPAGTPHRNETYYNPKGVWHIDRIPTEWRELFAVQLYNA